jgi:alanyl-tRNA synthetase
VPTERLYYTDSYATEFEATVVATTEVGGRTAVVLDRTAFYPASGGQPADTGQLGPARVVDVVERDEDDEVLHVVEGETPGGRVRGRIDWPRRLDHMQQHTGQHVLSAVFAACFGVETTSVHFGAERATIDLARPLEPEAIAEAEREANAAVRADRPVSIRFAEAGEAAALPLRREPVRGGRLRLVEIAGLDLSACGGTHVARTGEIGAILVTGWERRRGGLRVEFVCGGRAIAWWRALADAVDRAARALSVGPLEVPGGVARLQEEARELRRRLREIELRLDAHEAAALAARGIPRGGRVEVVEFVGERDAEGLKRLAREIATRPRHVAVLFGGTPALVVAARAADAAVDLSSLVAAARELLGAVP